MNRWKFYAVAAALLLAVTAAGAETGPGRVEVDMVTIHNVPIGSVEMWNTGKRLNANEDVGSKLIVQLDYIDEGWQIHQIKMYSSPNPVPTANSGAPLFKQFEINGTFEPPLHSHTITLDLEDDIGFSWGDKPRQLYIALQLHLVQLDDNGLVTASEIVWAHAGDDAEMFGDPEDDVTQWGWWFLYSVGKPKSGQLIDAPVKGLYYETPTHNGWLGEPGGFQYFPGEYVDFYIGGLDAPFYLGTAQAVPKVSPLDMFVGSDTQSLDVIGVARTLQTLDSDPDTRSIAIMAETAACFSEIAATTLVTVTVDDEEVLVPFNNTLFGDEAAVDAVLNKVVQYPTVDNDFVGCNGVNGVALVDEPVTAAEAQATLERGIAESGIFRKNVSKTEDWAESKQKLDIMPVYFPGKRSNGDPAYCDLNDNGVYDEEIDLLGVPYEEWRLNGDPAAEECDPREYEDPNACVVTLIECRAVAKPIVVTYQEKIDIQDDQVNVDFYDDRFAFDIYTSVSRDDGTTFKRMNVSRMADLSSFDLETGEPFHGTCRGPVQKINDNKILVAWTSTFCKSGNPRYAITRCDDPETPEIETPETGCAMVCSGNPDNGTEVCEPDYPYDDDYFVTDIWGVRGKQRSVNYDEVDDVADLGIGEIPYSCLWTARGVIVTQKELDEGTFDSLTVFDDNGTPDDPLDDTVIDSVELGDIIWYKPERLTSGRRDAYFVVMGSARGAGFAIAWQEDPDGLRPGKGKGPGQGWSGSKTNHKGDIWYSFISADDFALVDENFEPGGPGDDPNGAANFDERPGLGRPKPLAPFSLPVRVTDNDMVNSNSLKVQASATCVTPPGATEDTLPVCFPEVDTDGDFVPLDPEEIAQEFCDHLDADPETCCDPENHEEDPDCEDLKGLYGNLNGTKRYAYLARSIDERDNATGLYLDGGDGIPDYQYYVDRGGTLDLCDMSGDDTSYMDAMPGSSAHERWYGFTNVSGKAKLVCVSSDGRLIDGDVSASRPNIQLQPYTRSDGTKSAWVLLAYEETKGLGHSLAAEEHEEDDVGDEIIGESDDSGQMKPIKQDLGKNVVYHSFDYTQPDLVAPGHVVNLPALCGGLYPTYCDDPKTPDVIETNDANPTCTCTAGQPVPLYFDYQEETDQDSNGVLDWIPDDTKFLQYRTEIARRVRFVMQSGSKAKSTSTKTLGLIIFKQGQEGQGRPADVFVRRMVLPEVINYKTDNPFEFKNLECTTYLDETFTLPACPNGAGDKTSAVGYNCNVWGEATGDRLCGGTFADPNGGYMRRDHVNLTSADIDMAVDAGPVDDTPDDPTDDRYGTNKVLLWSQHPGNLGDESYGIVYDDGTGCDHLGELGEPQRCPGMYSNAKSHRGFIRGDFVLAAYAQTPNWAAGRNGRDRYNFYTRKSFDGGQTWTTTPGDQGGVGIHYCREYRTDPDTKEPPIPPEGVAFDPACVDFCPPCPDGETCECAVTGVTLAAGAFEPAKQVSQFNNNKQTSSDPRVGATPPQKPLDGRIATLPEIACTDPTGDACDFKEDYYNNNVFFVAWGAGNNLKSIGGTTETPESPPTDVYYTRTEDYGDHYLRIPWVINGAGDSSPHTGETVWRYDFLAHGEPEEQGECQLRATPDGSKMYAIWHSMIAEEEDPDVEPTRWYPWEPEVSYENDIWFRRVIFWPDELTTPAPVVP